MAVIVQQVDVGTTATRLDPLVDGRPTQGACAVRNRGVVAVYLGPAGVTAETGFQVDAGETFTVDLRTFDALYGITESSTATCHVIQASGN